MSSYFTKVRNKGTGETKVFDCFAYDDYFGKHKYGYAIPGKGVLTQAQFNRDWEEVI